MLADDPGLTRLAGAALEGIDLDWQTAETSAPDDSRPVVRELRTLASLAAVHRRQIAESTSPVETPAWLVELLTPTDPVEWGHLKIRSLLGRGATGAVYRAWDPQLDREVALKLLPAPRTDAERHPSPFIEEGRLLARVRHPNIVTIHGAGQIDDRVGLWMELVSGRTLEAILPPGATCSAGEALEIGVQLCAAVGAVHEAGLIHRDIKATNVMRADNGRLVLMDFGAGREAEDRSSPDLTGTPLYLAPEVFQGSPATVQSDLYSLGVLLYRLLTGSYPVQGASVDDVRRAHQSGERRALRDARSDLPAALVRAVDRALRSRSRASIPDGVRNGGRPSPCHPRPGAQAARGDPRRGDGSRRRGRDLGSGAPRRAGRG